MFEKYRYTRNHRLLKSKDFQFVLSNVEIKSVNAHFVLLARSNGLESSRLGFIVSKKAFPRAVDRNLVKRLMKESFRKAQYLLQGVDIVVISRKGQKRRVTDEVRDKMVSLWKKLRKRHRKFFRKETLCSE